MSSMLSLKDLVKNHYNIVSIDGDDIKLSSAPSPNEKEKVGLDEKRMIRRFGDYFDLYEQHVARNPQLGCVEPSELRRFRPFLLATEVAQGSSKAGSKMKNSGRRGKGKGKGGKKNNGFKLLQTAIAKAFTGSNPPPDLGLYVSDNKPYKMTQELVILAAFTSSTSLSVYYGTYFTINSLDQISQLSAVFDQYRIVEIEAWIIPTNIGSTGTSGGGNGLLHSVIDYDDAIVLSSEGQALDYTNVLSTPSNEGHYRRFTPHAAVAVYSGAFTSYGNVEAPWIDLASTSVQHYGLKTVVTQVNTAFAYNVVYRYHMEFRNVR